MQKLSASRPDGVSIKAEITETRNRLQKEVERRISEETSTLNTVHQRLIEDLARGETRLQGFKAKEEALMAIIAKLKGELKDLPRQQAELNRLEVELSVQEEAHKLIAKGYEDASIREADVRET